MPLAGLAASGYAVARLLLVPPDDGVLERFGDPVMRASWPLPDPVSVAALAILADGIDADRTREEWEVLFGSGPDPVDLTESGRLNESAAELGRELAEAYRAGGLGEEQVVQASAPDQLGRELWFLAHQVAQLARADEETAAGLRAEIAEFVRDHPRRFHEPVCAEFDARAVEPLWRALPGLVRGFVDQLDAWAS